MMVAKILQEKEIFLPGAIVKSIWQDGQPTSKTCLEVLGFVIMDDLGYQVFKFKYDNTDSNAEKILKLKNNSGIMKVKDMPGYDVNKLFNYRDQYFGQNLIELGDI